MFYLCQFCRPCAVGSNDAVIDEVALVRSWKIISRHIVIVTISFQCSALDVGWTIERLVHPIPDTTADSRFAALDDIPVLLQIADSLSHGMCILAHKERFSIGIP